jgi:hypothetical protein
VVRLLGDLQLGPPAVSPLPVTNDDNRSIARSSSQKSHHEKSECIATRHRLPWNAVEEVEDQRFDLDLSPG